MNWQSCVKYSMSSNVLHLDLSKKLHSSKTLRLHLSYFANMDVTPQTTAGAEV